MPRRIEHRAAAIPAFIGHAASGPLDSPVRVSGPAAFAEAFGAATDDAFLARCVAGCFENGGRTCWVVRAGDATLQAGLDALGAIEGIGMVAAPDAGSRDLQRRVIAHCEAAGDRMAILDVPADVPPVDLLAWRLDAGFDSPMAALYAPWLRLLGGRLVPPCGHVAGVWCRTEEARGIHRAPANEAVHGAHGVQFDLTDDQQGVLNPVGVNCIRTFPDRGVLVWGARTLSGDPDWRYVSVRRLFLHVSRSIEVGTRWAVFEPDDEPLWAQLRATVTTFLHEVWRSGALVGSTPSEAFFVRCDAETNAAHDVVEILVGIAAIRPGEFITFRVRHDLQRTP